MTVEVSLNSVLGKSRSSVLSGRADGAFARSELNLAELEASGERIHFMVPEAVREMTPSFVLGLFSKTLERISLTAGSPAAVREKFFALYKFEGRPSIRNDIDSGVQDFLDVQASLTGLSSLFERKQ